MEFRFKLGDSNGASIGKEGARVLGFRGSVKCEELLGVLGHPGEQ